MLKLFAENNKVSSRQVKNEMARAEKAGIIVTKKQARTVAQQRINANKPASTRRKRTNGNTRANV